MGNDEVYIIGYYSVDGCSSKYATTDKQLAIKLWGKILKKRLKELKFMRDRYPRYDSMWEHHNKKYERMKNIKLDETTLNIIDDDTNNDISNISLTDIPIIFSYILFKNEDDIGDVND